MEENYKIKITENNPNREEILEYYSKVVNNVLYKGDSTAGTYNFCLTPSNYVPSGSCAYSKPNTFTDKTVNCILDDEYWEEWDKEHPNGHNLSDFF